MTTKQPPAFQFYARDWLSGTKCRMLSPATRAAYIDLLCLQWLDGKIPDGADLDCWLQANGYDPAQLDMERLLALFPDRQNGRLEKERKKQAAYREKKAAAGRKGAEKRWGGDGAPNGSASGSANGSAIADPVAKGVANDSPAVCSLQSSTSTTSSTTTSAREKLDEKMVVEVKQSLPNCSDAVLRALSDMPSKRRRAFIASLTTALEGLPPVKDARGKTVLGEDLEQMIVVTINSLGPDLATSARPGDRLLANLRGVAARWNESPRQRRRGPKQASDNGVPKGWTKEEFDALAS